MPGGSSVRASVARLVAGWTLVLSVMWSIGIALPTPPSVAHHVSSICFSTADDGDRFVTFDHHGLTQVDQGEIQYSGGAVAADIEAIAMQPGGTTLFAADGGQLGTLDAAGRDNNPTTAVTFTAIGTGLGTSTDSVVYTVDTNTNIGTYTGGQTINFNTIDDIDGLTFDPFTQKLWGVVRIPESGGAPAEYDQLVIVDPTTGAFVPQQFRNPADSTDIADSVPVTPAAGGDVGQIGDIDDLAIDPATGVLWGVANANGSDDQLVRIDKVTGQATPVGTELGPNDIEGLGFSNVGAAYGDFFGATGNLSEAGLAFTDQVRTKSADDNVFWYIDTTNGTASAIEQLNALNLLAENTATVETDASGWSALANTTIQRTTAQARGNNASLEMTSVAAGDIGAVTAGTFEVVAGTTYVIKANVRSATAARNVEVTVTWPGGGGTTTSAGQNIDGTLPDGSGTLSSTTTGWVSPWVTVQAPTTGSATMQVEVLGTAAAGEVHYVDSVSAGQLREDYESMDCLVAPDVSRTITGRVFLDADQDGTRAGSPANAGEPNVSVRLYIDNGTTAGQVDGGDQFVDNVFTDSNGDYTFNVSFPYDPVTNTLPAAVPRDFVLDVNTAHLPAGTTLTTDNVEVANFTEVGAPTYVTPDPGDTLNDFGFVPPVTIAKTAGNATAPQTTDPIDPGTDQIEYAITVTNDTGAGATGIDLTDILPTGTSYAGTPDGSLTGVGGDVAVTVVGGDGTVTPTAIDEFQTGSGNTLALTFDLDANEAVTFTFLVNTNDSDISSNTIANQACRVYSGETVCATATNTVGGSIGDFVWDDVNRDVVQDVGEAGIPSITVALYSSDGATGDADCTDGDEVPVTTTTTDAGGIYGFDRLEGGEYCVDVDAADPDMPTGYSLTGAQTDPRLVSLDVSSAATRRVDTADFGYAALPVIDLELTKTVDVAAPEVGDAVTFTLTLLNNGASANRDATGVTVTDVLPPDLGYQSHTAAQGSYDDTTGVWTVGTLADGASTSMTITATVNAGGTHVNEAQVAAANEDDVDSTPADRTFPADDPVDDDEAAATVSTVAPPPPPDPQVIDLEVVKDVSGTYLAVGEEFTYTVTVTNAVPGATATAMNVKVTDQLPDGITHVSHTVTKGEYDPGTGLWNIGSLRRSEIQILTIVARADRAGVYANVAYVSSASGHDIDSTPGAPNAPHEDDEDVVHVEVGLLDLELTKGVSDGTVTVGEEFTFDISLANVKVPDAPATAATGVEVTDALPEGLRIVRVSSTTGEFDSETFLWFVGDLDVGESATLTLVVVADREGTFTNVAQVWSATGRDVDSTPGNGVVGEDDQDDAVVVVTIRGSIGDFVWLDRNGDGVQDEDEVGLGGVVVAIAGPFNSRPSSVGTIEAEDSLQTDGDGRYLFQELTPGLYIVVIMEDTIPAGLANTLGTTWYEVIIGPGASYVDADFGYQPSSEELSIVKTVTPAGRVAMGDEPVYSITVSNTGWRTLEDVVVTDTAPAGTTYRPGTTTLGGEPVEDATGSAYPLPLAPENGGIDLGDLEPGDSWTITFGVTVDFREPREIPNVAAAVSKQTGRIASNEVIIQPAIDIDSGEALPATGGPVDRLLLLGLGAVALGIATLWSVATPRRRRGNAARTNG